MKLKARLAPSECAATPKKWEKTTEIETPEDLPQEMIEEALKVWELIKKGVAKNQTAKKQMIEIYNVINNTNYSTGTNCSSCLQTCFNGIKQIYKKYKND